MRELARALLVGGPSLLSNVFFPLVTMTPAIAARHSIGRRGPYPGMQWKLKFGGKSPIWTTTSERRTRFRSVYGGGSGRLLEPDRVHMILQVARDHFAPDALDTVYRDVVRLLPF